MWIARGRAAIVVSGAAAASVGVSRQASSGRVLCDSENSRAKRCMLEQLMSSEKRLRDVQTNLLNASSGPKNAGSPLFKFGIIADIQHADIPDARNFSGSEARSYRGALEVTKKAVKYWQDRDILFVAQLGDLIDGQNAGKYGEGSKFKEPQSWVALKRISDELCKLDARIPYFHTIGNHELYNFSVEELAPILGMHSISETDSSAVAALVPSPSLFYYSFTPHPGWRIVMLNAYNLSTALPEGTDGRIRAEKILRANHPNADAVISGQGGVDYFEGLTGMQMRFVPFNGAYGEEQLQWLSQTLEIARVRSERVIVLTHSPLHPMACDAYSHKNPRARNIAYDAPEAMKILWEVGRGCVVAVFAGHAHEGGFFTEPSEADHANPLQPLPNEPPNIPPVRKGLHHVNLEAVLTHEHAYGHVEVYGDRLQVVGMAPGQMHEFEARRAGYIPTRTLPLAPFAESRL